jgi:hypothetical protein
MSKNAPDKFLYDALEKANTLGLKDSELTSWDEGRESSVRIEKSPRDSSLIFGTKYSPKNWPLSIGKLSPKVYLEGTLENLSKRDSQDVAFSLSSLQEADPEMSKKIEIMNIYDRLHGTTALWQKPGWGDYLRHIFSTKAPAELIHSGIDQYAKDCGLKPEDYQVIIAEFKGFGKGVKLRSEDNNVLKIFGSFAINTGASIKNLIIGEGNDGKLEVGLKEANEFVFPTPLRRISHADVNCFSSNGSMIIPSINKKAGAVYASDKKLEIVTETPEKMIEIATKMFHS